MKAVALIRCYECSPSPLDVADMDAAAAAAEVDYCWLRILGCDGSWRMEGRRIYEIRHREKQIRTHPQSLHRRLRHPSDD